jgi:hypothetical protein
LSGTGKRIHAADGGRPEKRDTVNIIPWWQVTAF